MYVITSNFEKLRFYIHNAVEHVAFNLFTLTRDEFDLLWLVLQKDNLLGGIPQRVKEESLLEEERVTKRLYKDYAAFKNDLWHNLCQNNPDADQLLLYNCGGILNPCRKAFPFEHEGVNSARSSGRRGS